jgi:hypothetical protein
MSRIALSVVLLLAVPCAGMSDLAWAQDEVVASNARVKTLPTEADIAKTKTDASAAARPAVSQDMMIARLNAAAPVADRAAPAAYAAPQPEPDGKRQVHGGAGVSIGTGGYRSGYVYSLIPVGDTGTLGIAYSDTNYGKNYVPYGYGYGAYYPGYDYRPYGYGYGVRGGRSQSLAISYSNDETRERGRGTPDGCGQDFRDSDRYVGAQWQTRSYRDRPCGASADQPW